MHIDLHKSKCAASLCKTMTTERLGLCKMLANTQKNLLSGSQVKACSKMLFSTGSLRSGSGNDHESNLATSSAYGDKHVSQCLPRCARRRTEPPPGTPQALSRFRGVAFLFVCCFCCSAGYPSSTPPGSFLPSSLPSGLP